MENIARGELQMRLREKRVVGKAARMIRERDKRGCDGERRGETAERKRERGGEKIDRKRSGKEIAGQDIKG